MGRVDADSNGEVEFDEFKNMVSWRLQQLGSGLKELEDDSSVTVAQGASPSAEAGPGHGQEGLTSGIGEAAPIVEEPVATAASQDDSGAAQ